MDCSKRECGKASNNGWASTMEEMDLSVAFKHMRWTRKQSIRAGAHECSYAVGTSSPHRRSKRVT